MRQAGCLVAAVFVAACGAADHELAPRDLELRDLLGVSAGVAISWSDDERRDARDMVAEGLRAVDGERVRLYLGARTDDDAIVGAMIELDDARFERGDPVIAAAVAVFSADAAGSASRSPGGSIEVTAAAAQDLTLDGGGGALLDLTDWPASDEVIGDLPHRAPALLAQLAAAAGASVGEPVAIAPARRAPFVALYRPESQRLLVNPVVLAVIDSRGSDPVPSAAQSPRGGSPAGSTRKVAASGNPYSFFGSVAECAAAERLRCESCIAAGSCDSTSRDASSGLDECETLAADEGVGYFLYCINLSLAIETVADCASTNPSAGACPQVTTASNQIAALDANQVFLDDPTCLAGLDQCLTEIYGDPEGDFPPPPADAGPTPPPPPPPPRDIDVGCGDQDCDFSPQCSASCDGPECGQLVSCQADCGDDSGCGSCENEDGGGCESGGGSGGSDSNCDSSCDSGSCDGGGCDGGGCDGGGCDGDGGGCDGGGCDGGGGGGCDSGGGGGGSSCHIARRRGVQGTAASVAWAALPLLFLGRYRRRRRRTPDREETAR